MSTRVIWNFSRNVFPCLFPTEHLENKKRERKRTAWNLEGRNKAVITSFWRPLWSDESREKFGAAVSFQVAFAPLHGDRKRIDTWRFIMLVVLNHSVSRSFSQVPTLHHEFPQANCQIQKKNCATSLIRSWLKQFLIPEIIPEDWKFRMRISTLYSYLITFEDTDVSIISI